MIIIKYSQPNDQKFKEFLKDLSTNPKYLNNYRKSNEGNEEAINLKTSQQNQR